MGRITPSAGSAATATAPFSKTLRVQPAPVAAEMARQRSPARHPHHPRSAPYAAARRHGR